MEDIIEALAGAATILPARERGNCRIWFQWKGKPVFISAGTRKPKEARQALKGKIGAWLAALPKEAPQAPAEPVQEQPMRYWVREFLKLDHEQSKPGTVQEAERNLNKLGEALGWPDVRTITKDRYREVYPALRDAVKPHTWANELGEHRRFAKWLVTEDIILRNFTDGVKRPQRSTFGTRTQIYKEEWFQMIWEALEHRWRPVWEDHWFTGMDTKDIWEFELQKHLLPVGNGWKIWKQRAKETEIIDQPLSSRIKGRWMAALASGEKYLHPDGHRYASVKSWSNQARKALHAAQRKLGLPLLDFKTTRHTFATRHLLRLIRGEKNAPTVEEIQRWLGHAKGSTEIHRTYLKLLSNPHMMD